jgi:AsmA family protein
MSEQPSPEPRPKTWKWILAILAILVFFSTFAAFAILSSIDFNTLKPFVAQVVKRETGRDLEIRGAIDVKLGFRPSLVIHDLLFQNAPWASRPEMVKIRRAEARVMVLPLLKREIHIAQLVLLEPDIFLETDKSGKWNFEFEVPEGSSQKSTTSRSFTLPVMAFHQVQVEKGNVSYRKAGTEAVCCLAIDRFTARSEGLESPLVLAFNGSYKDKPLELRGTVGSLLLLKEPGKGYPVDLVLKASSAQLKVEGTIQDLLNLKGLALKIDAEVQSTSQLAAFLGKALPVEFGPLQTTAAISDFGGGNLYKLSDFRVSSKAGDAQGSLTLTMGDKRPKISGAVSSQSVDLNFFLNGGKTGQGKTGSPTRKDRIFPKDPLPLDVPKNFDAHLKFEAGQVRLGQLPLANLSMEATLQQGRLTLTLLKVRVAGGDAQGRMEMLSQGSVATAKAIFRVNQMDLRSLSTEMKLEGKLDLDLDLLSRGSSIAGLMAGLNGGMVAVMGQGRVDNKSIQILGGPLAGGAFELLNPSSKTANHTDINCAVSGFDIKDGMAKVTALVVDTSDLSVVGEGQVNLRDETLDLALKPYSKGGAAGFSLSLAELAKSFKLRGTLASPSLQMDAEQTVFAALKAAGGVLLFGPAGIVAALAGESSDEENPCLAAIESAKKGVKGSGIDKREVQNGAGDKGFSGTLKGVGESIKKLFSMQGSPPQSDSRSDPYKVGGP